jgi:predicted glycosyltransferase
VNPPDSNDAPDLFSELIEIKREDRPSVLAMAGGGEDGFDLLKTFIESAKTSIWQGQVVAGPLLNDQRYDALCQLAKENGVALRRFSPSLTNSYSAFGAIVCMGGYNTLSETLSQGMPIVCVPRTKPRSEQLLRASVFEKLNLLRMIKPDGLNVTNLLAAVNDALQTSRSGLLARVKALLEFAGANQAANHILNLCSPKVTFRAIAAECSRRKCP